MSYRITAPASGAVLEITPPASKSISNRALILYALSGGEYAVANLSDCDDTSVLVSALSQKHACYDIGAAGTSMRFLTAYLALQSGEAVITGSERMKQRPIAPLVDALRTLGAQIAYREKEGCPPLHIRGGKLHGGSLSLPGNVSSQYISALLMIAPCLESGLQLQLSGKIISRPYIEMTRRLMAAYGVKTLFEGNTLQVPAQSYKGTPFSVESDWSAASYWYEIAALASQAEITLWGLEKESVQGDAAIARYFETFGVSTRFISGGVVLTKRPATTSAITLDLSDQPDMAQTLVVTALLKGIPFRFTGLESLRIKETDRLSALQKECAKLGAHLQEEEGSILSWNGLLQPIQQPPRIDTYDDHRMAMAFAPAAYRYSGLCINHPEVVSKSYPAFWADLQKAGFQIESL